MAIEEKSDEIVEKAKPMFNKLRSLRIVIIEPRGHYCRMVWCAIGLGISHIMLGATIMTVLIYSLIHQDLHAILNTVAFHFFSAEAILSLNYANGWSTPMRLKHRRFAHVFLQMCSMVCATVGTVLIFISKGFILSPHGITGYLTTVLAFAAILTGPCALFGKRAMKVMHTLIGMPTFVMSSVSFGCGLFTPAFENWAPFPVVFILLAFIIFYTTFIMVMCCIKLVGRF